MRFLSCCSGIEAASVAWEPLGWAPVAYSEIEAFPSAVLAHRFPRVPNLGDMTTIQRSDLDADVDLLVGGTPCQSFSVAGLRKGLADPRGNLALAFLRLAAVARAEWLVWENVPGVLSSNGGRDFGAFLGGLAELGYGFAWRVLDAQYVGVPQRRRRVFLVGRAGDWRGPAAVLFERHSLSWDPPPRRAEGTSVAALTASGVGTCGADDNQAQAGHLLGVTHTLRGEGFDASEDGTGRGTPLVPVAFDPTQITSGENRSNPQPGDPCHTLARGAQPPAIAFHNRQDPISGPVMPAIGAKDNGGGVAYQCHGSNVGPMGTLRAGNGNEAGGVPFLHEGMAVRRLTPRETERLQGFPDDWTRIPWRGKPAAECPDGPRYRAVGNSMAVPVMAWIGRRIQQVVDLEREAEAAA